MEYEVKSSVFMRDDPIRTPKEDRCFSNICSTYTNFSIRPPRAAKRLRRSLKISTPHATWKPTPFQAKRAKPIWCASAYRARMESRREAMRPPSACLDGLAAWVLGPKGSASCPMAMARSLRLPAQRSSSTCTQRATFLQAMCSSRPTCARMPPRCRTSPCRSWARP